MLRNSKHELHSCSSQDLQNAPSRSVIIFHGVAHNPTGSDPTPEQWQQLSAICKERGLIPLFDTAYQGFASGDVDKDAYSVRLFVEQGHEVLVCQSFAKNFGLYNERVGNLNVVTNDPGNLRVIGFELIS